MGLFSPTFFVLAFQLITGYGLPSKFGACLPYAVMLLLAPPEVTLTGSRE